MTKYYAVTDAGFQCFRGKCHREYDGRALPVDPIARDDRYGSCGDYGRRLGEADE